MLFFLIKTRINMRFSLKVRWRVIYRSVLFFVYLGLAWLGISYLFILSLWYTGIFLLVIYPFAIEYWLFLVGLVGWLDGGPTIVR